MRYLGVQLYFKQRKPHQIHCCKPQQCVEICWVNNLQIWHKSGHLQGTSLTITGLISHQLQRTWSGNFVQFWCNYFPWHHTFLPTQITVRVPTTLRGHEPFKFLTKIAQRCNLTPRTNELIFARQVMCVGRYTKNALLKNRRNFRGNHFISLRRSIVAITNVTNYVLQLGKSSYGFGSPVGGDGLEVERTTGWLVVRAIYVSSFFS